MFSFCSQYTFLMYRQESVLFLFTVHISNVPSWKCSLSVHSTHFWCTVKKVFCFCSQYTFLMYRQESVLFLWTVFISDVPSGKCSVSVHSTHFWYTIWKMICFFAQYTFLMYCQESVLFLCTVHISDAQCCDNYVMVFSFWFSVAPFRCNVTILKTVPIPI